MPRHAPGGRLIPCTIGLRADQLERLKKIAEERSAYPAPTYADLVREAIDAKFPPPPKPTKKR